MKRFLAAWAPIIWSVRSHGHWDTQSPRSTSSYSATAADTFIASIRKSRLRGTGPVAQGALKKGLELVQQVLPGMIAAEKLSLVVLGHGEEQYEQFFHWLQGEYPGRVGFYKGFNNELAHLIEAGSDLFLMPSRYEPCGLPQMYSLKYGTVPVVRATGGLADSVQHYDPRSGTGTGVVFHDFDANGLTWAIHTALDLYANKNAWKRVIANGMAKDYSWQVQGKIYLERFRRLFKS